MQARPEGRIQSRANQDTTQPHLVHRLTQEEADATKSIKALPFRLVADFTIQANAARVFLAQPDLTPQQRSFFTTVLTNPEALNRMCRLAIVSELESLADKWFEGKFEGPDLEDVLNCELPFLSKEDQEYWSGLRQESPESVDFFLMPIFVAFTASLQDVAILDSTTDETIPNRVCSRHHPGGEGQ
jgi:hypothetical protein